MRLIDADKLLEHIRTLTGMFNEDLEKSKKQGDILGEVANVSMLNTLEGITDYINDMESLEWIPVEQALPETKGEYLVTYHPCYHKNIDYQTVKVGMDSFRGKTTWAKNKFQLVIAWMPLLEAYKGE